MTGTLSGPDSRSNIVLRSLGLRITLQSMATVRMRLLSAMMRPLASKMRPRSGGISTVRILAAETCCLVRGRLDALQEPQARANGADQQHRHQRQHAETRRALIDRHGTIVVCERAQTSAPGWCAR